MKRESGQGYQPGLVRAPITEDVPPAARGAQHRTDVVKLVAVSHQAEAITHGCWGSLSSSCCKGLLWSSSSGECWGLLLTDSHSSTRHWRRWDVKRKLISSAKRRPDLSFTPGTVSAAEELWGGG